MANPGTFTDVPRRQVVVRLTVQSGTMPGAITTATGVWHLLDRWLIRWPRSKEARTHDMLNHFHPDKDLPYVLAG